MPVEGVSESMRRAYGLSVSLLGIVRRYFPSMNYLKMNIMGFVFSPYPGLDDIERREGVRLIKTHLPVHLLPKDFGKAKAVLYIYRNPKDTVVSYYHFMRTLTYTSVSGEEVSLEMLSSLL